MDKAKYLRLLRYYLSGLPRHRIEEILDEYRRTFATGAKSGKTEQEICMELGHPRDISEQYLKSGKKIVRINRTPLETTVTAVALILLSIIVFIPLSAVLIAISAAMFASSFIFGAGGALIFVFSAIKLFVEASFVVLDLHPISALFFSASAMSLSMLLVLSLKPCITAFYRLIYGCIIWTSDTARGIKRV